MTDDHSFAMLQRDVERLETRTAEQASELAAVKATVTSMGREIGQLREDFAAGMSRIEQRFDRADSRSDAARKETQEAREETRVWISRFGWLIAASFFSVVLAALVTRALT